MKKFFALFAVLFSAFGFASCGNGSSKTEPPEENTYTQIDGAQAKQIMDTQSGYIIIDARTQEEYDAGHIEGAVLIPEYAIAERAEKELPDKNQLILVYCRSGRRSKIASQALADLGYSNVKEFGGIIDWEYETVK